MKVDDTKTPSKNIFDKFKESFMGQNPRKMPKNDIDISNILPTKTRGKKDFDMPDDDVKEDIKDNLKDAGIEEVPIITMSNEEKIAFINTLKRPQLIAYISTNATGTSHKILTAKSKDNLYKIAIKL